HAKIIQAMNFQAFENYIEDLCEQHKDLLHGTNGRVAFARLLSDDDLNSLAGQAHDKIITIENVSGIRIGTVDEMNYRQSWAMQFIGKAALNTGTLTVERDNILQLTWEIMMQFVA